MNSITYLKLGQVGSMRRSMGKKKPLLHSIEATFSRNLVRTLIFMISRASMILGQIGSKGEHFVCTQEATFSGINSLRILILKICRTFSKLDQVSVKTKCVR